MLVNVTSPLSANVSRKQSEPQLSSFVSSPVGERRQGWMMPLVSLDRVNAVHPPATA